MTMMLASAALGGGARVTLDATYTVSDLLFGVDSTASFSLESDGDIVGVGNIAGDGDQGDWIVPRSAAGAAYEVRFTHDSGTAPTGVTLATWLALSSTRTIQLATSGVANLTSNITVEIRRASTGVVQDTATLTLNATRL